MVAPNGPEMIIQRQKEAEMTGPLRPSMRSEVAGKPAIRDELVFKSRIGPILPAARAHQERAMRQTHAP